MFEWQKMHNIIRIWNYIIWAFTIQGLVFYDPIHEILFCNDSCSIIYADLVTGIF